MASAPVGAGESESSALLTAGKAAFVCAAATVDGPPVSASKLTDGVSFCPRKYNAPAVPTTATASSALCINPTAVLR